MRVLCEPWTSEWPIMDLEFPQSRYNISDHCCYLWNISHWEAFLEMKQAFWRKWESYFKKQWRGADRWWRHRTETEQIRNADSASAATLAEQRRLQTVASPAGLVQLWHTYSYNSRIWIAMLWRRLRESRKTLRPGWRRDATPSQAGQQITPA